MHGWKIIGVVLFSLAQLTCYPKSVYGEDKEHTVRPTLAEAREALARLIETRNDPQLTKCILDIKNAKVVIVEGTRVSFGLAEIDPDKCVFYIPLIKGNLFWDIAGEFKREKNDWVAVITNERRAHQN